ncbi:hypothetical protein HK405_006506, partial [Cladochytrium tenue]
MPKWVISSSMVTSVRSLVPDPSWEPESKFSRTFVVQTPQREYVLRAPTAAEFRRWTFLLSRMSMHASDRPSVMDEARLGEMYSIAEGRDDDDDGFLINEAPDATEGDDDDEILDLPDGGTMAAIRSESLRMRDPASSAPPHPSLARVATWQRSVAELVLADTDASASLLSVSNSSAGATTIERGLSRNLSVSGRGPQPAPAGAWLPPGASPLREAASSDAVVPTLNAPATAPTPEYGVPPAGQLPAFKLGASDLKDFFSAGDSDDEDDYAAPPGSGGHGGGPPAMASSTTPFSRRPSMLSRSDSSRKPFRFPFSLGGAKKQSKKAERNQNRMSFLGENGQVFKAWGPPEPQYQPQHQLQPSAFPQQQQPQQQPQQQQQPPSSLVGGAVPLAPVPLQYRAEPPQETAAAALSFPPVDSAALEELNHSASSLARVVRRLRGADVDGPGASARPVLPSGAFVTQFAGVAVPHLAGRVMRALDERAARLGAAATAVGLPAARAELAAAAARWAATVLPAVAAETDPARRRVAWATAVSDPAGDVVKTCDALVAAADHARRVF